MNRLFALGFALLLVGLFCLAQEPRAQVPMTGAGLGAPISVSGLSLDGSGEGTNNSTTSFTIPLTTTKAPGVIVVGFSSGIDTVSSVTASGLTFTKRVGPVAGTGNNLYEYAAPYSSNFSGNITIANSGTSFASGIAFGVSGAPSSSYFDPNVSLPATTTTAAAPTGTTTTANDIVFVFVSLMVNTVTPGSGWSRVTGTDSTNYILAQYQLPASAGSYTGNVSVNSDINGSILDAIIP
jgi:hypothetical protein